MARTDPTSELIAATAAVEAELQRFEDATAAFGLRQQILAVRAKLKLITKPSASA